MPNAAPPGSTSAEDIEARRQKILALRLRQQSIYVIAEAVGTTAATVSRDLDWIREHWREAYGRAPTIEPGEILGEALAVYLELERLALAEHRMLLRVPYDASVAKVRLLALELVAKQRERRMNLLMDLGVLDRAASDAPTTRVPRAAEMRRLITGAVVTEDMLIPDIERDGPTTIIDVTPI